MSVCGVGGEWVPTEEVVEVMLCPVFLKGKKLARRDADSIDSVFHHDAHRSISLKKTLSPFNGRPDAPRYLVLNDIHVY